jgi:hypothetical protein
LIAWQIQTKSRAWLTIVSRDRVPELKFTSPGRPCVDGSKAASLLQGFGHPRRSIFRGIEKDCFNVWPCSSDK